MSSDTRQKSCSLAKGARAARFFATDPSRTRIGGNVPPVVHHLAERHDVSFPEQRLNVRGAKGRPTGLERGGGNARGGGEINPQGNRRGVLPQEGDPGNAEDVGDFVRIGADGGRPVGGGPLGAPQG